MDLRVLSDSLRNAAAVVETNVNRRLGRTFVPRRPGMLHIETCSICNLDCCFCAYGKKHSPKVAMSDALFAKCIAEATAMGFSRFELTPCTGDVFMDRRLLDRLEQLDAHPGVRSYEFFTNFTIPRERDIERLLRLEKLRRLTISIYGHDAETFCAITDGSEKLYRRLVHNLDQLHRRLATKKFDLEFGWRSTRDVRSAPPSELTDALARFERAGIDVRRSHGTYNNWGGYVTKADVRGLPIDIRGTEAIYKNGPCALLFTTVQVMATGVVNGCACRDVDATLRIGDLNTQPLNAIITPRNPAYMALIEEQERGAFRPVCRSCDFYKSIYRMRRKYGDSDYVLETLDAFRARGAA
jgi:uncharacterized Fe-S cluster-containing radical SAM superfamily protein